MTATKTIDLLARRLNFLVDAVALREIRGWPNDPVHNAAVVYKLHGWPFDRRDAAMIRAEAAALRAMEASNGQS